MNQTFANFIVGPSNHLAYAAAMAVVQTPGTVYNPLVLYGGRGLGKTHLLQAMYTSIQQHTSKRCAVYMPATRLSRAGDQGVLRSADICLLDDVQFLLERTQGQEIFLRAFRTLCEVEKQIVVALDRSPQALISEDIRLCSRLTSGLVAEIQPPAVETRVAIAHAKAHESGISLSQNVAMLLASALPNTIRDLEKGLARLVASASLQGRDIDEDFAYTLLHQLEREAQQVITVAQIQQMVAKRFGLTVRALQSRKRHRAVTFPRQIAMFLCRDLTQLAVPAIAQHFGGRNTNTVLHACGKVVHMLNTNEEVAQLLWELRHALQR